LGLGEFLLLGKGEKKQNGAQNSTNLANALEALIGAVYLDSDLENVWMFIKNNIFDDKLGF
ncbi:MAG: ribonuclease III, partial [Thermoplasmata archaeon]